MGIVVKGKRKRLTPEDSVTPHDCVVLAIDVAENSGFCISHFNKVFLSGECRYDNTARIIEAVAMAMALAELRMVPCVLVLEKPFARNMETVLKLGACRQAWVKCWTDNAIGHKGKVVNAYLSTWRSKVLGPWGWKPGSTTEECRAMELKASELIGGALTTPDANAAICISLWARHAGEVARVLPISARGKP